MKRYLLLVALSGSLLACKKNNPPSTTSTTSSASSPFEGDWKLYEYITEVRDSSNDTLVFRYNANQVGQNFITYLYNTLQSGKVYGTQNGNSYEIGIYRNDSLFIGTGGSSSVKCGKMSINSSNQLELSLRSLAGNQYEYQITRFVKY